MLKNPMFFKGARPGENGEWEFGFHAMLLGQKKQLI